jgi:hypothetical protein
MVEMLVEQIAWRQALVLTANILVFCIPLGVVMLILLVVRAFYEGLVKRVELFSDEQVRRGIAQEELEGSAPRATRDVH